MKKLLFGFGSFVASFLLLMSTTQAASVYQSGTTGVDLGYPNCRTTVPKTTFGVVGTEGGLGFTQNPCLVAEASQFSNLSLYANTGYPGATSANAQKYMQSPKVCAATDLNCIAYDYGYN